MEGMETNRRNGTTNPAGSPKLTINTLRTPFENFEGLATKLLQVPKEEVDKKRAERENTRKRKRD